MFDLDKPIPTVVFPENKVKVETPVDEELITLNDYFICDSAYYHWKEMGGQPLGGSSILIKVRKSVFEMLKKAEALLPEHYRFKMYDGYRSIEVQQSLWDFYYNKNRLLNPSKTEDEIKKMTAFCVSFPSYDETIPSLHNTGGAIDLTIIGPDNKELDMGCDFDDFTNKAWTNHFEMFEDDEIVKHNRRLLYNVMIYAGFTNLPSEWWHYDYGDDKWAQLTQNKPIYKGIL